MANNKIVEAKKNQVDELAARIEKADVVLLTDYRGITVESVTKLRKDLMELGASYSVIKNNIIKRAFNQVGVNELDEVLAGPTAVITCEGDYLQTAKAIYNFTKENDFYTIKGGTIEGNVKSAEEITVIAQLPSREELLGQLAGVLLANISKLAVALDQVKEKKEA